MPFKRLLYAVGSNDATAFSAGVNVTAVRIASYGLGGLFAGCGGLALTALVHSSNASTSTQYALVAIAAVVLGGTSLAGGRGGLIGVVFGAFSIYLLQNLLANFQVNPAWLQIVYGGILIAAVVIMGALVPETGTGGLKPVRMPLWHRSKRRSSGLLLSEAAVAQTSGDDGAVAASDRPAPGLAARATEAWRTLVRLQQRLPMIQLLALAAVFTYGVITLPGLGSWISIRSILVLASLVGLASCGQTLLILMGGFDLGVAGFIVAGGLTVTALKVKYGIRLRHGARDRAHRGGDPGRVLRLHLPPLQNQPARRDARDGLDRHRPRQGADRRADQRLPAQWLDQPGGAGDQDVRGRDPAGGRRSGSRRSSCSRIFLHRTRMGRGLFATGANPRAADRALINTRRVWVGAFAFSAVDLRARRRARSAGSPVSSSTTAATPTCSRASSRSSSAAPSSAAPATTPAPRSARCS